MTLLALDTEVLSYAVAALGLLGGIAMAVAAYRKAPAESTSILVGAAKDVVTLQTDLVTSLRAEMVDLKARVEDLEKKRRTVEEEAWNLKRENAQLRLRVDMLEAKLAEHGILIDENVMRIAAEERRNTALEVRGTVSEDRADAHGVSRADEHEGKIGPGVKDG